MILGSTQKDITNILSGLTLSTERLFLRHIVAGDVLNVYEYACDPEVARYLTWPPHKSIEETREFVVNHMSKDVTVFAIVLDEKVIGSFDLRLNPAHNKASFGYALNRNYWGQGIMTEVLACVMDYAFNVLQVQRMESTHYAGNETSGRVMEKCGFVKEGFSPKELYIKGKYVDIFHFGITRADYTGNANRHSE